MTTDYTDITTGEVAPDGSPCLGFDARKVLKQQQTTFEDR